MIRIWRIDLYRIHYELCRCYYLCNNAYSRYLTSFDADEPRYDMCFYDQSDSKNSSDKGHMVYGIGQLIRMNRITDKRLLIVPDPQVSQSSSLIDL